MQRTKSIKIRLTEQEHLTLLENKQGRELSTWLRQLGLGAYKPKKFDPALVREVARIGTNLNQIAKAVNQSASVGSPIDKAKIVLELALIKEQLNVLLERQRDC